ncbi:hypothetical protein HY640_02330 [Candidatus Woesearchaeota archaeon]|nr:hypothetical protein [Candidatus Woesearchaeota archaeon]
MIKHSDFSDLRDEMNAIDSKREASIALSRDIIRLSKQAIYSVHRDEFDSARKLLDEMKGKVSELVSFADIDEGHFRAALQEFVEAACVYGVVVEQSLPQKKSLGVSVEHYLLGVCDLSGELVRRAVNSAAKGRVEEALRLKDFLDGLYGEMLKFDFRNGDIRRKFDGMKYDLRKLEDLAFELRER